MSFSTTWKAAFRRWGVRPYIEVIIDPDDRNIILDGYRDIEAITSIVDQVEIDPMYMNQIMLNDIYITFNDSKGFLNPASSDTGYRPFRYLALPIAAASAGDSTISLSVVTGSFFKANDHVTISDGTNSESHYVDSVSGTAPQQITLKSTLTNSYAQYSIMATVPIFGKHVEVRLRATGLGLTGTQTLFKGIIREPFQWSGGKATLKADNILGEFLRRNLTIQTGSPTPTQRCNASGSLASTIAWSTQTGSGTLSGVTAYTGCNLGAWSVTFSDATNFTVTGPNCNAKAGSTAANFFDQTDATDSQIQIPSANWGGTPNAGDVLDFTVSVNFSAKSVPEIVHDLAVTYAEMSTDYVSVHGSGVTYTGSGYDDYAFNYVYNLYSAETITVSFDTPCTVGEAIASILRHAICYVSQDVSGKLTIGTLKPGAHWGTLVPSGDTNHWIPEGINLSNKNFYNNFECRYGWDYANQEYQYTYRYPEHLNDNISYKIFSQIRTVSIDFPAFYTEADVAQWIQRYYAFWAFGPGYYEGTHSIYSLDANVFGGPQGGLISRDYGNNYDHCIKIERQLFPKVRVKYTCIENPGDILNSW